MQTTLSLVIREAGLDRDERGLVPLPLAREKLRAVTAVYAGRRIDGEANDPGEGARLWACLLSLEDAEEFCREAQRLHWLYSPGMRDEYTPLERYGEAIEPWLSAAYQGDDFCDPTGCILPILCHLGERQSLAKLLKAQRYYRLRHSWPDGELTYERVEGDAAEPARRFARQNPDTAWGWMLEFAQEGDRCALSLLHQAAEDTPTMLAKRLWGELDPTAARMHLGDLGLFQRASRESVLKALDEGCLDEDTWPVFQSSHPDRAYHAMRLVVLVQRSGEGYWIVFETLEGSEAHSLCLKRYVHSAGSHLLLDSSGEFELFLEEEWDSTAVNLLVGPEGEIEIAASDLQDLESLRSTARDTRSMLYSLLVRAYLREYGSEIWPSQGELLKVCHDAGMPQDEFEVLLVSTSFEHVVGNASNALDPEGIDRRWRSLPSESPVYQSLARAIVERDASLFAPGVSNLDWRLHLEAPRAERQ